MNIHQVLQRSGEAFAAYGKTSTAQRAIFLETIAAALEARREALTAITHEETNLPAARLNGELTRTTGQLKMFANLLREGSWVMAAIDTADAQRTPPKPDTRKMAVPLGPVVVFGASNFPYAFSTAGGDTASALAAGCTVVIRAHYAHPRTSALVFEAMQEAVKICGLPPHTIQHVTAPGNETGKELVTHPLTTAVGFTGSLSGGKALMQYAAERPVPVPVFAEMSSINPVLLLPGKLKENAAALASKMAASITLGMGQFCTNPGLMIGMAGAELDAFLEQLKTDIAQFSPQPMLHEGIRQHYETCATAIATKQQVRIVADQTAMIATISAQHFLDDPHFREEVFGPFSLLVQCHNKSEMQQVLGSVQGQLTATLMATEEDLREHADLLESCARIAGRVIINEVPTGVEVCASMVHGGPFPAASDPRFTSVGTSAIQRWVRPVCFQNFPDHLLPEALQNANPLRIWRTVNNEWTNT